MSLPEIVSRAQWRAAREELLVKEEAVARAREALNAERRRLPMVEVETEYVFEGGDGKAGLLDLFEGRRQLIVHHFVFAPEWETGCRTCSAFLDQIGHLAHLWARDTSFAAVSRAPYTTILPFKARMGWTVPWLSSYGNDFDRDFEATREHEGELVERSGVSCFLRDRDRVFHTYSAFGPGLDGLGSTASLLDLTALGRQEDRARVRYHDEYED
ncbi:MULTISPECIES: DUF899 domain-containing protein [Streptomyces]|uniref:DUF899 domain-containing protein n=1 Tax=Streptomyces fuscus TaxID=3048495 RepID=A0ABT7IWA6_9ACTN|nr:MULTISPECIES: DUF899 domain-containing protein [Streptomyces]MCM1974876.1 DUF899 domain-containing protein [Streptomyces sp. G1]MDL2076875.1 DUF899 domain-containing protein [Streptomyces fuscus]